MTNQQQPELTPAQAAAKITELKGNQEFVTAFLAGNGPQVAEFHKLHTIASAAPAGDRVDMAVAGKLYEGVPWQPPGHLLNVTAAGMLKDAGLGDDVIRQALSGQPVSQVEHDAAEKRKATLMRDQDWTKKYLANDGPAREEMTLLHVILTSPIKKEAAA